MFCTHCGKELEENHRFCPNCGTAVEPPSPPDTPEEVTPPTDMPSPSWGEPVNSTPPPPSDGGSTAPPPAAPVPPQSGSSHKSDLSLVLKIVAGIGALLFALSTLGTLGNTISGLVDDLQWVFAGYFGPLEIIFRVVLGTVFSLVELLANGIIFLFLLTFVLNKQEENHAPLFLGLCGGSVLLAAVSVVSTLFHTLYILLSHFPIEVIPRLMGSTFVSLLFAAAPALILFLLLHLMGQTPLKGGIRETAGRVLPAVKSAFGGKETAPAAPAPSATPYTPPTAEASAPYTPPTQSAQTPPPPTARKVRLRTDRGLLAYILLSIVTCGIYSYIFLYSIAQDVNTACEGDGKKTSGLLAFILLGIVTCGFYPLYWYYSLGNRLAANAPRYNMNFQENGTTILLWYLVGSLLCGIGPYVAMHILIKNTNSICSGYNQANGLYDA